MVLIDETQITAQKVSNIVNALIGGLSGMVVTTVVHPFDLVKVRMQVYPSAKSTIEMAKLIVRCEGFPALFVGLSAGVLRQATYTTTRLGVYYWLYEEYRQKYGILPNFADKMTMGAYAGLVGAIAGNPSEVLLVRMMADGKRNPCLPEVLKPRYKGLFHAIHKITSTEGPRAFWRGSTLTLARSVFVSLAQIGAYTQAREVLVQRSLAEGTALHIYTSIISSFFTAATTLPVDLVKTRYQYTRVGVTSMTQREVFDDIIKTKGIAFFWKGFFPYFMRLSLHTTLTYIILDEINNFVEHNK